MTTRNPFCYRELRKVPRSEIFHDGKGNLIHKPHIGSAHWVATGEDIDDRVIPIPLTEPIKPVSRRGAGERRIPIVIPGKRIVPGHISSKLKKVDRTLSTKRNKKAGK